MSLVAQELTKTFQDGRHKVDVLRGVSLEVGPGEVVVLEGPSGSGKTTLLSILGCILTPTGGRVVVDGVAVDGRDEAILPAVRRSRIGFVFQQFNLFASLTALENVAYALNVKGVRGAAAIAEGRRVLESVGLGDRLHFHPRDLSGGQKQRVAIARAVAGAPRVVLADEPTASVDGETAAQILGLFRGLARENGAALVVVTHDPRVRTVADRVLTMREGRLS